MRFTQKIKYNLKRALPLLTIAGAGLMASCDKDDEPSVPSRDVELEFYETPYDSDYSSIDDENLQRLAKDPSIANIYMKVLDKNNYFYCRTNNLRFLRNNMERRTNISSKIHGRGNFNFPVGVCAKEDSLWFVAQGWTINKQLQH